MLEKALTITFFVSPLGILLCWAKACIISRQKKKESLQCSVGAKVTTHSNISGIIIRKYQQSVIIETTEGKKAEVYNYSIKTIDK